MPVPRRVLAFSSRREFFCGGKQGLKCFISAFEPQGDDPQNDSATFASGAFFLMAFTTCLDFVIRLHFGQAPFGWQFGYLSRESQPQWAHVCFHCFSQHFEAFRVMFNNSEC
jgi:hypothetical protein